MCSGRLLLLAVLCLAAVASATNNKIWPHMLEIDMRKCVATRFENNFYICMMKSQCDTQFVAQSGNYYAQSTNRNFNYDFDQYDPHCLHGFSIRPMTPTRWEIEVIWPAKKGTTNPFTLEGKTLPGDTELLRLIKLNRAKKEPLAGCELELIRDTPEEAKSSQYYMRLEFECPQLKDLIEVQGTFHLDTWPNEEKGMPKEFYFNAKHYYKHFPCKDMTVLRTKPLDARYRTEYPVFDSDHNVYDFARMCKNVFRDLKQDEYGPYHNGKFIESIECLPQDANKGKTTFNGAQPNKNTIIYTDGALLESDIVEVTCRTKKEHCFNCDGTLLNSPEFAPPNSSYASIKLDASSGTAKCPSLTCDSGLFMFPQIDIPTKEAPACIYNETASAYQWTITQHDPDAWARKRVRVTGGYCWKKGGCAPLPEPVLKCFVAVERCEKAKLNITQSYTCDTGYVLHVSFTRRIPLEPVVSVSCNEGEFEVTTREGVKIKGFTDESWLICKKLPLRPRHEPNVVKKPHPVWRALFGAVIGVGIYLVLLVIALILRIPYVKLRDFWEATEVAPEYSPSAVERREKEAAAAALSSKKAAEASGGGGAGGAGGAKLPTLKKGAPPPHVSPYRPPTSRPIFSPTPIPPSLLARQAELRKRLEEKKDPAAAAAAAADSAKKKKMDTEEKTCIEPTNSELEKLIEQERIKDCTEDDDQTGRDVKPIEKED